MKLIIKDVPGDGQCMFSSIAYVLLYNENKKYPRTKEVIQYANKLRKKTVAILKNHVDNMNMTYIYTLAGSYNNLAEINNNNNNNNLGKSIEKAYQYIQIMKKKCSWGGNIEIKALENFIHMLGYKGIEVYRKTDKGSLKVIKDMGTQKHKKHKKLVKILLEGVNSGGIHFRPIINGIASIK